MLVRRKRHYTHTRPHRSNKINRPGPRSLHVSQNRRSLTPPNSVLRHLKRMLNSNLRHHRTQVIQQGRALRTHLRLANYSRRLLLQTRTKHTVNSYTRLRRRHTRLSFTRRHHIISHRNLLTRPQPRQPHNNRAYRHHLSPRFRHNDLHPGRIHTNRRRQIHLRYQINRRPRNFPLKINSYSLLRHRRNASRFNLNANT